MVGQIVSIKEYFVKDLPCDGRLWDWHIPTPRELAPSGSARACAINLAL